MSLLHFLHWQLSLNCLLQPWKDWRTFSVPCLGLLGGGVEGARASQRGTGRGYLHTGAPAPIQGSKCKERNATAVMSSQKMSLCTKKIAIQAKSVVFVKMSERPPCKTPLAAQSPVPGWRFRSLAYDVDSLEPWGLSEGAAFTHRQQMARSNRNTYICM